MARIVQMDHAVLLVIWTQSNRTFQFVAAGETSEEFDNLPSHDFAQSIYKMGTRKDRYAVFYY